METEEFSFPRICDNCASYGIDSPPLWNLSPAVSPNHNQGDGKGCFEAKVESKAQRKSLTRVQQNGEEEPMDLLWEGFFNEDLTSSSTKTRKGYAASSSSRELVEFRCSTMTVSKANNGALVQTRNRPGMVVIVKVLKRLFFLNNSHGKIRRRAL